MPDDEQSDFRAVKNDMNVLPHTAVLSWGNHIFRARHASQDITHHAGMGSRNGTCADSIREMYVQEMANRFFVRLSPLLPEASSPSL